jgi:Fe-S-cluster containining protein
VDASDVIRCKVEDEMALMPKLTVHDYRRWDSPNTLESKHCSKCSYELTREQINTNEDLKLKVMEEKQKQDIEAICQEMNLQFSLIMSIIQENYKLAHITTSRCLF